MSQPLDPSTTASPAPDQAPQPSSRAGRRAWPSLLVALAATAAAGATALPAAAAPTSPVHQTTSATVAAGAAYGKVYKNVWHTAPSYYSGLAGRTGGYVYAGRNYFYCQGVGQQHSALGYHNNWWLYTDDDNGHRNVWISAVYVSGGGNDQPIPGVPRC